jgi:hypothetical protein
MANNIYQFRRIKRGEPKPKLKVLFEDFQRRMWFDRLSVRAFRVHVAMVSMMTFTLIYVAASRKQHTC